MNLKEGNVVRDRMSRSKVLALGVMGAFLFLLIPVEVLAQAKVPTGSLSGIVYKEDLETPVKNAVVKIKNVKSGKKYESDPTDKTGAYEIKDIEQGRYVLGVSTAEGDYNFEFEIFIKANEEAKLSLALEPTVVAVVAKKHHIPIFLTPLGIASILGSVIGSTGLIYGLTRPVCPPTSPSKR